MTVFEYAFLALNITFMSIFMHLFFSGKPPSPDKFACVLLLVFVTASFSLITLELISSKHDSVIEDRVTVVSEINRTLVSDGMIVVYREHAEIKQKFFTDYRSIKMLENGGEVFKVDYTMHNAFGFDGHKTVIEVRHTDWNVYDVAERKWRTS